MTYHYLIKYAIEFEFRIQYQSLNNLLQLCEHFRVIDFTFNQNLGKIRTYLLKYQKGKIIEIIFEKNVERKENDPQKATKLYPTFEQILLIKT